MSEWREAYKPAAPARLHLVLAASMWTVVGALLLLFGVRWALAPDSRFVPLWLALAMAGGCLKAWFVLRHAARRTIDRIRSRGDGRCIGGFLSWQSWMLVGLMVFSGWVLRHGVLPRTVLGLVYVLVGTALLLGAGQLWNASFRWDSGT